MAELLVAKGLDDQNPNTAKQFGGLHILSNFGSPRTVILQEYQLFKDFINNEISRLHLSKVGEVYHNFEGGGFTGVVCLAESHLSVHTWPSQGYVTFDVYLSNHMNDNSEKAKTLYQAVLGFFDADVLFEKAVNR